MRPLVLLHGFTGAPASWDPVVPLLPRHCRPIVRPALPGHDGRVPAPLPPGAEPFEAETDRLAARLREAGVAGAHLAGYSLGARVALGLLVRHPDLWSGATLIGVHPGLADDQARARRAAEDREWITLLRREGAAAFVREWEARPLFASQARLSPSVLEAQAAVRCGHHPEGLAVALERLGLAVMPDWRPHLEAVSISVALLAGELDETFLALARDTADRLPAGRLVIAPGAGHNLVLEAPTAVAAVLGERSLP